MSLPRFSVNNSVLVNMLMLVLLFAGTALAFTLVREMFPETRPDQVTISVIYPAVQPDELEKAVTIKIEEAIRDLEEIEKVDSTVQEGMSTTVATLYNEVDDIDTVREKIDIEISAINNELPDDIESITVRNVEPMLPVLSVSLFGEGSEAELKKAARDLRDELLELPGISDITISGTRDDEISVEIRPLMLLEYDLTFQEVASAIRATNLDVSAGNLKGPRANVNVRTLGEEIEGKELGDIVVKNTPTGKKIYLRDVATIRDEFVDVDIESYFNGKPSVTLIIQKTKSQDAIQIANMVRAYVRGKQQADFDAYGLEAAAKQPWYSRPFAIALAKFSSTVNWIAGRPDPKQIYETSYADPFRHNFEIALHSDLSRFIRGRLDLMTRNGMSGLVLVLLSLILFLNWRVALWAAMGLPISFMGTFLVMWMFGVSINLLSMFGLIIVLGIIVDDAIVIGENIFRHVEEGEESTEAAVRGAEEVMWPVIVAVTTTIAGFAPLLFIKGRIGDFMRELPIVVLAALSVSLIEALVILPAHLRHLKKPKKKGSAERQSSNTGIRKLWHRLEDFQESFMQNVLMKPYEVILRGAMRWRYVTIAGAISLVFMSIGLMAGGIVPFEFIQKMDSETVTADIEMPIGTVIDTTREKLISVSELIADPERFPEVNTVQTTVGSQINLGGTGATGGSQQSHLGQVIVELLEADQREKRGLRSSEELLMEFRKITETLTGVNSVKWEAMSGGPAGKDIEIKVVGEDLGELYAVSEQIKTELASYEGVVDLDDDYDLGKREVQLRLLPSARATGITVSELGNFVRFALYGIEARRITRNREDVKIMVRLPEQFRSEVYNLEMLRIPRPANPVNAVGLSNEGRAFRWVPISEVAELTETRSYTSIHRAQQRRSISIYGDVEQSKNNANAVMTQFQSEVEPVILREHPNVSINYLGTTEEQTKSFSSLLIAIPAAFLLIYMLLAGLFRSYFQPIVVMSAIPFGVLGAIIGHWVTGNPVTFLSCVAFLALSGILVNDSLVLVDFINTRIARGIDAFEANVMGAKLRLRAILLTSLTTAAGLMPLMFETSFQAKFLIPMAVTLTYGLVFATALTLIIVPCLNMIFLDVFWVLGLATHHRAEPGEEIQRTPEKELAGTTV
ncbi:efflux RND transporter permease subunit [Rubinisphaera margarita]|uniref:efflux RND transporter permease subunit n=1 Tax=Rubinisphaera margarita TaxID=2909586 RepID=UPI001EE9042E|nr:efflux RND transporter permease subunit [Rubinisphaera margarita]MCG6155356.1 efflux RND transporter permease subunit [Rubinisphaera margarita]